MAVDSLQQSFEMKHLENIQQWVALGSTHCVNSAEQEQWSSPLFSKQSLMRPCADMAAEMWVATIASNGRVGKKVLELLR